MFYAPILDMMEQNRHVKHKTYRDFLNILEKQDLKK